MCWSDISAAGDIQRAFLMHACLLFWAIRLTYNWMRSWDGFSHEDWRYIMMKGKTNNKFQYFIVDFGSIHLIPTLCVYMALLPMIYALSYPLNELGYEVHSANLIMNNTKSKNSLADEIIQLLESR